MLKTILIITTLFYFITIVFSSLGLCHLAKNGESKKSIIMFSVFSQGLLATLVLLIINLLAAL